MASIANGLVGVGASGNLSVNASAMLHVKLGLDLNIVSMSETALGDSSHNEVQTLVLKGTGGNFTLTSPFERAPHNVVATADTGGTLTAAAYYYVVTSMIGSVESAHSQEVSAPAGATPNTALPSHSL